MNKVRVGRNIEKIVSSTLIDLGFIEHKLTGVWEFTREVDNEEQIIRITKSTTYSNSIRLEIDTTSNDELFVTQETLRPSLQGNFQGGFVVYEDEEGLKEILDDFLDIILHEGTDWLKLMSTPDIQVDESWVQKLASDQDPKADIFAKEYALNYSELDCLVRLEKMVLEQKEANGIPDKSFVIHSSCYEFICKLSKN